ncbi:metal ABC transporter ATP-binding protein [Desulfosporosinus sp. PR]|uniref:metal ABC transporter ATP-binding protein n=1 Tax=Candidatus Desulfosporosinus nitrosoreducens TaxID=3401928 RepID=UPI0027E5E375|nr:metal ABC transporter ATP-binding protein [Desulfosporosinus sp. PR]MDQ7093772.1 metal ABC transporter ATP-binding protein [Desulfosporosinus sp. PR]
MGAGIVVEHLNVQLGGISILRDLSFTLKPGEFLGIIGPNGAGKTTLLQALLGMVPVKSGTITFRGDGQASGSSMLGYAPQARQLDLETPLRAWDFVSFGLPHRWRPWLTRQDRDIVREAMQVTDSERLADKAIGKLSGGERQRLFIAQALVRNPQILLLDEPTSNLDPGAQENLASVVHSINGRKGISVLFVSHDVNLIAKYAHRILYITKGQYALGTVKQVLQANVLTRLYGAPVEVLQVGSKLIVSTSASKGLESSTCFHDDNNGQGVLADVSL